MSNDNESKYEDWPDDLCPNGGPMEGFIPSEDDDIYEWPGIVLYPNFDFYYDFNSLYRYWLAMKKIINEHKSFLEDQRDSIKGDYWAERELVFGETYAMDIEKFPDFLLSSIISFEISILENYLESLSKEIAKERGIPLEIDKYDKRSFLDKYLYWLRAKAGFEIDYSHDLYKTLDAVRMVRNSFLHRLGNDLPEKAKKIIREIVQAQTGENIKVDEEFVEASFAKIAEFVELAEHAYIEDWEKRKERE